MSEKLLYKANCFYREGKYEKALAVYRYLVQEHPYFTKIVACNIQLCERHINTSLVHDDFGTPMDLRNVPSVPGDVFEDHVEFNNWQGWQIYGSVLKEKNGALKCRNQGGFQCVEKTKICVQPDNYYQLDFTYQTSCDTINLYWIIRKSNSSSEINYYDDNQAPVIIHEGSNNKSAHGAVVFRSFCDNTQIDLHLFVNNARPNDLIKIVNIRLKKLEHKEACIRPMIGPAEKIIASLASTPGRVHVLRDIVRSLYYQVDEIRIFLNGYEQVPLFLHNDPKITNERSQIWGDNGDAGKFFWADDPTPGYRLICDDDIVYPVDYAHRMIQKLREYNDKAIVGLHGILLKQPIDNYYNPNQRRVRHFRNNNPSDFPCHVLGTGVIAYHNGSIRLSRNDFHFRNMADIWLAKIAQEQSIPLICISRTDNWVMSHPQLEEHSIYNHSTIGEASSLNTASIQTNVIRGLYPVKTIQCKEDRAKLIFSVKTYNRQDYLKECIDSFLATRSLDFDWVVIIADDGSTDGTLEYLDRLVIPHELHIIKNNRRYAVGQCNTIFQAAKQIGFDVGFQVDDDIVFTKLGWDELYVNAINQSGYDHLCYLDKYHFFELHRKEDYNFEIPAPIYDHSGTCIAYTTVEKCMGALFTFTQKMIKVLGSADEDSFPVRGQWHIDLSIRACRAGFNNQDAFFDARGSNSFLMLQNEKQGENYQCSIPWCDEYIKTKESSELQFRLAVMMDKSRIYISPSVQLQKNRNKTLNSFFDKIYVLNLDRRTDRWERLDKSADKFNIELHRFPAIDGNLPPYNDQYRTYSQQGFIQVPENFFISNNFDFYRNYPTDMSRVAYLEKRNQCKAIGSPGAWGYLLTMIAILEDALKNEYEQILVLDDDIIFHKQFNGYFSKIIDQVPNDWLILQLGALQYNWDEKWIEWYSDNLYMCKGCSLGSHAVGMRRSIIPLVLNYCQRFDLPYDEGPLHKPKALYPQKCLTFYPNLLIQDVSESDISDKTGQKKAMSKKKNTYHWDMDMYLDIPPKSTSLSERSDPGF